MPCEFTHSRCHIDLSALRRNFLRCGDPARLMPVIKADAYGHGLLQVARALEEAGATCFAVGRVDEGCALRDAGHRQPVVSLMPPVGDEMARAREKDILPIICTFDDLERARAAGSKERPLPVTIKVETGMHRLGFREEDTAALVERLRALPEVRPALVLSHCSSSDDPDADAYTIGQVRIFDAMAGALRAAFPGIRRSMFNSAGNLVHDKKEPYELERPGITLYGDNPLKGTSREALGIQQEWVMSLSAPVLQTTVVRKGECVSYGRTFTAPSDMRLAVVSAGYATGVPRILSNRLEVLVHGHRARQVGRVCMSMIMVDITNLPGVAVGDEVWLLGGEPAPGETAVTPREWADALGTISYEILCSLGAMNPRTWHG